ncbi:hypothetical protein AB4Y85_09730 [Microvirga sp. 2YAF29]|uniref:hypothetical protein n=1 Tax=Microvirga sp. 2YAF29 TaxID=3233031 RepID=UPI003F9B6987
MPDAAPLTRKDKAFSSLKHFGGIFLYLWALLSIPALHKSLILSESGIHYRQGFAIVNALMLAKIIFVAAAPAWHRDDNTAPVLFFAPILRLPGALHSDW